MSKAQKTGVWLFLFGFGIAFLFAFVIYGRQGAVVAAVDVNGLGGLGRNLASGEGFSLGAGLTMRRAPLYPGLVALLLKLFGTGGAETHIYRPVFFVQCLMVGAEAVTVWMLGRSLFGERTGRTAGVLVPLLPQTLRYVSSTEVETLMGLLIALTALTGWNLYRRPTPAHALVFGIVCAASTLTKPIGLFYPLLFSGLLIARFPRTERRNAFVSAAVCLAVYGLCLLPWSVRNSRVSEGRFRGISTNAPGEFLRGYVLAQPKFYLLNQDFGGSGSDGLMWDLEANDEEQRQMKPYGVPFYRPGYEAERRPMPINADYEVAKDQAEGQIARARVLGRPLEFAQKFAAQLYTFWLIVETKKKSAVIGGMAFLLLGLAFFGVRKARRQEKDLWPVLTVLLYFYFVYAAILAFARYSFPLYPTLLVFAVAALVREKAPLPPQNEESVSG